MSDPLDLARLRTLIENANAATTSREAFARDQLRDWLEVHARFLLNAAEERGRWAKERETRCRGEWPCEASTALAAWEPEIQRVEALEAERDAAVQEVEALRARLWEEAARYLDAREAIAIWRGNNARMRAKLDAVEPLLRRIQRHEHFAHCIIMATETLQPHTKYCDELRAALATPMEGRDEPAR